MGERGDTVTVQPFCMDLTEVTVAAYASCVGSGICSPTKPTPAWPNSVHAEEDREFDVEFCNGDRAERGNHPVNCVDWDQSTTYCHAQSKRLPTEEEWEWAARGESLGRPYPWGSAAPDVQLCWSGRQFREIAGCGTCPVASFREGDAPGGIHDLAGNVWEWTSSRHDASGRVLRGGSWTDGVVTGAAQHSRAEPSFHAAGIGFRCAR
jgi:formylglycine-generating enzyme required for sulfatase activity